MGSFANIHVALNALLANQIAMQVVEHNVANANTPGYHRQSIIMRAAPLKGRGMPPSSMFGNLGTGVMVKEVRRFNVEFFDLRYRSELANSKRWEMEGNLLTQVEASLTESGDDSLTSRLDNFWSGWRMLSTDPDMPAVRAELLERSQDLARALNGRASRLNAIRQDQNLAIVQRVNEINSIAGQLAQLNSQIGQAKGTSDTPNDLLDERDRLIDRLAEIAGAVAYTQDNNQTLVSIGGHALVVGKECFTLEVVPDPVTNLATIRWKEDLLEFRSSSGELTGLFHGRDVVVVDQMKALDELAAGLIARINTLHTSGLDITGAAGLDFFTGTDAMSIRVNSALTPEMVAASSTTEPGPGNGELALMIADVQKELLFNGGTATANQFDGQRVANLALAMRKASLLSGEHGQVFTALSAQRESMIGVSLDEEAANMVKYQRAYQAAARLMTAVDEMLDQVINRMGLVGR